jgi:hypothetical protein
MIIMKKKNILNILMISIAGAMLITGCNAGGGSVDVFGTSTVVAAEAENSSYTYSYPEDIDELTDDEIESAEVIDLEGRTGTYSITEGGTYRLKGSSEDCSIVIDADDDEDVTLILDNVSLNCKASASIYVASADKVNLILVGDSTMSNGGSFDNADDEKTDAVIYSKSDLTISGEGSLTITSPAGNGIVCKDSLCIYSGVMDIDASDDGINVNDELVICGGTFTIEAGDDGIHADMLIQIDGGTIDINAAEGLEATSIVINDGNISISATDDGINAAQKVDDIEVRVEINGGNITIVMAQGDTDGIDSNGDLIINGGTVNITGQSSCDYDGKAELNGGTLIVNGEEVNLIPNQFMGGMGGNPGGMGGFGGGFQNDGSMPEMPDGGGFGHGGGFNPGGTRP